MTDKTKTIDGWEIHDSIDGRRWLGHVAEREDTEGAQIVRFDRCMEMWPWSHSAVAVPQAVQDPRSVLSRNSQPPQMQIVIQNVEGPAFNFTPPFKMPFLPPWTIRSVGGCPLSAYPEILQASFLEHIQGIEEAVEKALRDAARTKTKLNAVPNAGQ